MSSEDIATDGSSGDDDPVDDFQRQAHISLSLPPGFEDWPLDKQAQHICQQYKREGLILRLLESHDIEPEFRDDGSKETVTFEELAKLLIKTVGVK